MKFKQFAALPFRLRDNDLEILLITTRKKRRWSVPKGWPIKRSSPLQTAATEAYEEAGVHGTMGTKLIGQFKKRRVRKKRSVLCDVKIYPLRVQHQRGDWPEKHERSRIWVTPRKAVKLIKKPGLRRAIKNFKSGQPKAPASQKSTAYTGGQRQGFKKRDQNTCPVLQKI